MIVLLPPSEGKSAGGSGRWRVGSGRFGRRIGTTRAEVVAALQTANGTALKVTGRTERHAVAVNQALPDSPWLLARDRYSGVVYQGLDVPSLPSDLSAAAGHSILVLSGLLGVCSFDDPVPDYRASMDITLPSIGPLYSFWRPHLTEIFSDLARRSVIIDLSTTIHRRAFEPPTSNWIAMNLVHPMLGSGHAAKFAKGVLTRWLLDHDHSEVRKWRHEGWRVNVL